MRRAVAMTAVALVLGSACSGGGDGGASLQKFCGDISGAQDVLRKSPDTAEASLQFITTFDGLAVEAPGEIRDDMQAVQSFLRDNVRVRSELSADPSSSRSASRESELASIGPSITAATDHIAQYVLDHCGVDLKAGSASASPAN